MKTKRGARKKKLLDLISGEKGHNRKTYTPEEEKTFHGGFVY